MKDIVIKWKWVKREVIIILLLYIIANLVNILSILIYGTSWNEIFTSQRFVLYITEWLYIISIGVRVVYFGIKYLFRR
jgi:hypothetical protein